MKKRITSIAVISIAVAVGLATYVASSQFTAHQQVVYDKLTAATNCQTDILAPFIQRNKLAHILPDDRAKSDFSAYLGAQVASGSVSETAAQEIVDAIRERGQDLPVYTSRGWVLPILVQR